MPSFGSPFHPHPDAPQVVIPSRFFSDEFRGTCFLWLLASLSNLALTVFIIMVLTTILTMATWPADAEMPAYSVISRNQSVTVNFDHENVNRFMETGY
jgi:hypothetical protein